MARQSRIHIEYQGRTQSLSAWAKELGIALDVLYARIKRGWTVEQTFQTPIRSIQRKAIEYQGRTQSLSAWAKELGIAVQTLELRFKNGWTVAEAFENPPYHREIEYKGKRQTVNAWAKELGLSQVTLNRRILRGWSIEQALETPPGRKPHKADASIIEFQGKAQSIADWAKELNISTTTLEDRIKRGWSLEDVLKPVGLQIEYNGKVQSVSAWARELGVSKALIRHRLRRGWTVAEALEVPKDCNQIGQKRQVASAPQWTLVQQMDPPHREGNTKQDLHHLEYKGKVQSLNLWARELGLCKDVIRSRLKYGWTVAEAFEIPKGRHLKTFGARDIQIEYQGKTQPLSDWASELKLNKALILKRLKRGWTVAEAFEIPKGKGRLRYLRKRLNAVEV